MRAHYIKKQSGQVIVVLAICMVVLIGAVGVAVDSGMGYMSKAKLNAAVDSAAIAAARAVSKGANQMEQRAEATRAANDFFAANFVNDPMNKQPVLNSVRVDYAQNGRITFDLDASSKIPTTFSRVLGSGLNEINIKASAETIRKDIDLAFVVQTSWRVMDLPQQMLAVRKASKTFLTKLNPLTDRVALIQFNSAAQVREPFRADQGRGFNRTKMNADIDAFVFDHKANVAEGLWRARDHFKRVIKSPSSLRIIVLYSDEAPNALSAKYTFNPASPCNDSGPPQFSRTGTLGSNDKPDFASPFGLEPVNVIDGPSCWLDPEKIAITSKDHISNLPVWYNAHDAEGATKEEFRIQKISPRRVESDIIDLRKAQLYINRAARNLAEDIAKKARDEGIIIFTVGLSSGITKPSNPDFENGEKVLKCIANATDAAPECRSPGKPAGRYCFAPAEKDLAVCYDEIAAEILRLTK